MSSDPSVSEDLPENPGKALVVDDDPGVQSLYADVLLEMGFQVDTAVDGLQGLSRIQSSPYSVIISDVKMPGMTGVELFLKSEQFRPGSQERFIFTTGLLDNLNTHEYMIVTEKPCIIKPAKVESIRKIVLDLLRDRGTSLS